MPFQPTDAQLALITQLAGEGYPWRHIARHPDINTTVGQIRYWAWGGNFIHPGVKADKKYGGWDKGTPDRRADFGYVEKRGATADERFAAAMQGQQFDSQTMKPIGRMRSSKPATHIATGSIGSDLAAIGGAG